MQTFTQHIEKLVQKQNYQRELQLGIDTTKTHYNPNASNVWFRQRKCYWSTRAQWLDSCIVSSEIIFLSKQDDCMEN